MRNLFLLRAILIFKILFVGHAKVSGKNWLAPFGQAVVLLQYINTLAMSTVLSHHNLPFHNYMCEKSAALKSISK